MRIKECGEIVLIHEIAAIKRVLWFDNPVDTRYILRFIGLYRDAVRDLAAGVGRLRQVFREGDRRGIETGRTDLSVWNRLACSWIVDGARNTLGLASRTVKSAEIARESRRR